MAAWKFEFKTQAGDVSTIKVHQGTGRWVQQVNDTGELSTDALYTYNATYTFPDGDIRESYCLRNDLLRFRRLAAKKQETSHE